MSKNITDLVQAMNKVFRKNVIAKLSMELPHTDDFDEIKRRYEVIFPELRKLKLGDHNRDIVCKTDIPDPRFNTNITAYIGGFDEMNWGYYGTGPWTLALNILFQFTEGDRIFAQKYVDAFLEEVIVKLLYRKNVTISYDKIYDWIAEKRLEGEKSKLAGGGVNV